MKGFPVSREQYPVPVPASRTALALSQLYCRVISGDSMSPSAISIPHAGESILHPKIIFAERSPPGWTRASSAGNKELGFYKALPDIHASPRCPPIPNSWDLPALPQKVLI